MYDCRNILTKIFLQTILNNQLKVSIIVIDVAVPKVILILGQESDFCFEIASSYILHQNYHGIGSSSPTSKFRAEVLSLRQYSKPRNT